MTRIAAALVLVALVGGGCGGGGDEDARDEARRNYHAYRVAEDDRTDAEERLRRAFADMSRSEVGRDRAGVLAAVRRGQSAARDARRLLETELDAARALTAYEPTTADGQRLAAGLRTTRSALVLVERELAIGAVDPFLARRSNAAAIKSLARRIVDLSVRGELAIRRADRAIAETLEIEPRFDPMFDR